MARRPKSTARHLMNLFTLARLYHLLTCDTCQEAFFRILEETGREKMSTREKMEANADYGKMDAVSAYPEDVHVMSYNRHDFQAIQNPGEDWHAGCCFRGADGAVCNRASGHPIHSDGWEELAPSVARKPQQESNYRPGHPFYRPPIV